MRIIQAGVGGFGTSWLYAVRECDGFHHVAVVDPSNTALEIAGEILHISSDRRFNKLSDALSAVEADGLIDVTPAPLHKDTTTAAIEAGLHVLVEKPISDTMDAAVTMVREARAAGRTLMVTQQYRYQDQPRLLRKLISEGAIGELDHVVCEFQIQGLLAGWRKQMHHPFLMDMAIHHFDLVRYLTGSNAVCVTAQTWNPKVSNAQGDMCAFVWAEMECGVHVNYTGSFASPGQDTSWPGRWVLTGTRGSLVWNPRDDWGPVRIFRQTADLSQYFDQHFFTPLPEPWGEPVWPEPMGATGHHYDLYHWRACVESGAEPETSGRDNLNTLAFVLAAVAAADSGTRISVTAPGDL